MERLLAMYISSQRPPKLLLNRLFHCPEELGIEKVWMDDTQNGAEILSAMTDHSQPLGIDKDLPARHLLPMMEYGAGTSYVNASLAIDICRGIKDADEQEKMAISSHINDLAMEQLKAIVKPGVTERELAGQINDIFVSLGAERGEGLVAFGANAADPHHESDGTVLREGDAVLYDVGGSKDGYLVPNPEAFREFADFVTDGVRNKETYGEPFDIPTPDELVFISWFDSGEVFRSGCTWYRGRGKIFYFQPGHETNRSFYNPVVRQIWQNACQWAAPTNPIPEKKNIWYCKHLVTTLEDERKASEQ